MDNVNPTAPSHYPFDRSNGKGRSEEPPLSNLSSQGNSEGFTAWDTVPSPDVMEQNEVYDRAVRASTDGMSSVDNQGWQSNNNMVHESEGAGFENGGGTFVDESPSRETMSPTKSDFSSQEKDHAAFAKVKESLTLGVQRFDSQIREKPLPFIIGAAGIGATIGALLR